MSEDIMPSEKSKKKFEWLTSAEVKKILRISDCELMHRRERGELVFQKKGNAYFYKPPN